MQVISGSSVLGSQDRFFVGGFNGHKGGQLMFDPSFCGTTTVNLLSSPDPALMRASASVPKPGTLAQAARGRRVGGLSSPTPYDELRYPGKFYRQAAPRRIATVAALFGLRPPALATSRILELGCGPATMRSAPAWGIAHSGPRTCECSRRMRGGSTTSWSTACTPGSPRQRSRPSSRSARGTSRPRVSPTSATTPIRADTSARSCAT